MYPSLDLFSVLPFVLILLLFLIVLVTLIRPLVFLTTSSISSLQTWLSRYFRSFKERWSRVDSINYPLRQKQRDLTCLLKVSNRLNSFRQGPGFFSTPLTTEP